MIHGIYSMQLGFHPVEKVGKIVQKQERDKLYTKGETIKNNKKHGIHKIENLYTNQENKHTKNIKKLYSSN
jgi:hypothetical protein